MPRWCRNLCRCPRRGRAARRPPRSSAHRADVQGSRQRPHDILETGRGVVDGELELVHLPGVLDQPQFAPARRRVPCRATGRPGPGGSFPLRIQVLAADAGHPLRLAEVGAPADPELAVAAVPVELLAVVARGAWPDMEHGLVAARAPTAPAPVRVPPGPRRSVRSARHMRCAGGTGSRSRSNGPGTSPAGITSRSPGKRADSRARREGVTRAAGRRRSPGSGLGSQSRAMNACRSAEGVMSWLPVRSACSVM